MPAGDRTGPTGMGPMTGRAAGFCAGYSMPGYANPVSGRAAGPYGGGRGGFSRGRGRGYRNNYWATGLPGWQRAEMGLPSAYTPAPPYPPYGMTAQQELDHVRNQAKLLGESLKNVQDRIDELEKEQETEE